MSGLESFARALQGDITYDTAAWDRLTALAMGAVQNDRRAARESHLNSLGTSLIAFKHAHDASRHAQAVEGLRDCLGWRLKAMRRIQREKIAEAAVKEWVVDMCESCLGSRVMFDRLGVCRPCLTCSGSGRRRYSDEERAELKNLHVETAHAMISFAVASAIRQAEERLR